ncbi:MAG: ribosome maturation factor RimM [Pseudomonadota bacterium]
MTTDQERGGGPGGPIIAVGRVVGAHGVRGELRVVAYSGSLSALEGKERVFLVRLGGGQSRGYGLVKLRPHKSGYLMSLEGITDRDAARSLAGAELVLPEAELPALEEDEYYWYQLVGLEVVTVSGERLGRVAEIFNTGAADVLVVRRPEGETPEGETGGAGRELLLPVTAEVVRSIALAEGIIVVEPPEGL